MVWTVTTTASETGFLMIDGGIHVRQMSNQINGLQQHFDLFSCRLALFAGFLGRVHSSLLLLLHLDRWLMPHDGRLVSSRVSRSCRVVVVVICCSNLASKTERTECASTMYVYTYVCLFVCIECVGIVTRVE